MLFNYLAVPMFKGKPKVNHLKPIADKIVPHFDAWQGRVFSYVGRVCLINYVITSSFVHSFMVYKWPADLLNSMQKSIKNFIWTSLISDSFGVHVNQLSQEVWVL